jgi:hypothetical protein
MTRFATLATCRLLDCWFTDHDGQAVGNSLVLSGGRAREPSFSRTHLCEVFRWRILYPDCHKPAAEVGNTKRLRTAKWVVRTAPMEHS